MSLITETYYLSLTQDNRGILRLRCSQDDTLRTVNLKLYNNGSVFVIPSGVSASISGVRQNGTVFSQSCTISQDRESVVLQLSSDITAVDGIIVAEIVLSDGEGGRLGTSNFIIQVEKNPIRAGVVQDTETPIEYINDFIEKIQTLTARLNNLITPSGDASLAEVVDARNGILGNTTYPTLGARLNAEFQRLSNALNGITILESTGDTTDRTSEILSKLNAYGVCKFGKGDFYVKNLVMPEDTMLVGSGNATRIVLLGSETNSYIVKPKSGCIIENISFYGGFTGTYSELIASSDARRHCIILDKFNDVNSENVILSNITIDNFVGSAIVQRYTTGCHCKDVVINMCYAGIDISNASYDGQCTNIFMTNTRYGVVQNGSNFVFTNCVSKDSDMHIFSDQQNTECIFSSCTFFDSNLETTSRLAFLSNARNGFVFDNCMFDSSLSMILVACDGIVIKGTNFVGSDTFAITVSNGRNTLLLITDCIADVEPVVTNAGAAARITSCYLKDGTAWSISEADITVDEELSDESENPIQNKAVASAISEINESLGAQTELINGIPPVTDWVDGKSIASGTGIENTASANFKCTDFVEIPEGVSKLWVTMRIAASYSNLGLAFYNSEKTYISGVRENYTTAKGWEYRECNVPSTAKYFRSTWYGDADTTEHPSFDVYTNKKFDTRLDLMQNQIDSAIISTADLDFNNVFDPNDEGIETGYEIASNGNKTANTVMMISGFIPCEELDRYIYPVYTSHFGTSGARYVACFNASKEWVRSVEGTLSGPVVTVTIPKNYGIKYFRVNVTTLDANSNYIQTAYHSHSNFMVIKGTALPDRFVPYVEQKLMDGNVYSANEDLRNPLYGKKVVFLGDSICEASTDDSGGFSQRIGMKNTMLWENAGIGGSTIAITGANKTICTRQFKMTEPDYIILEGGTNDADRIGTATGETKPANFGTYDPDDYGTDDASTYYGFDINTFCGACDYMCKRMLTDYPGTKIGFVGAHKMGQVLATRKNRGYYIQTAMDICKKWGIPVLDLWNGSYLNPMLPAHYTSGENYLYADGQHLYPKGYAYITPMIEAFMKSL